MEMDSKPKSYIALYSLTQNLGREKGDNFELLKIRIQDLNFYYIKHSFNLSPKNFNLKAKVV